jgi:hypothetical protein
MSRSRAGACCYTELRKELMVGSESILRTATHPHPLILLALPGQERDRTLVRLAGVVLAR